MAEKEIKRFLFNCEWKDTIKGLPDSSRLRIYEAIIAYADSGSVGDLEPMEKLAFEFIRKEVDWYDDKYEEKRRRRSEAGKKGMTNRWHNKDNKNNNVMSVITSDNKNNLNKNKNNKLSIDNKLSQDNIEKEIPSKEGKEKEIKNGHESTPKTQCFVKPGVEEVRAYAREKGYSIDAVMFWNFYEAKGWKVGRNQMKSWRAAVVTWARREQRTSDIGKRTSDIGRVHFEGETDPEVYNNMKEKLANK